MTRHSKPQTPEELFEQNQGLVYHIARRYHISGDQWDDLIQEGMLALWRACTDYDASRGYAFSTLAGRCIKNAMMAYATRVYNRSALSASPDTMRRAHKLADAGEDMPIWYWRLASTAINHDQVHIDDEEMVSLATVDDYAFEREDELASVRASVDKLPKHFREVIVPYFGLDGQEPRSQPEIADALGISVSGVSWRCRRALKMLREAEEAKLKNFFKLSSGKTEKLGESPKFS